MPEAIKAALTTELAHSHPQSASTDVPQDIQYMPPGSHRIHASRGGKPVSLGITVDSVTAFTLDAFLQAQLAKAADGTDDRPFFDFNHEDREAAAWPTEFYWAGTDPKTGGVRAKVEWSGAGRTAVEQKTFRRFSPTFIPDQSGHVISSETNMGGLVNRAAFKKIQPLFAKNKSPASSAVNPAPASVTSSLEGNAPPLPPSSPSVSPSPSISPSPSVSASTPSVSSLEGNAPPLPPSTPSVSALTPQISALKPQISSTPSMAIKSKLQALQLIDSVDASDDAIAAAVEARFNDLASENQQLKNQLQTLETERQSAIKAQAAARIEKAIQAGRLAPADKEAHAFWQESLMRDQARAIKALEALPGNAVLDTVTAGEQPATGLRDKMGLQSQKLAEIQAAHPQADFQTIFAKAQTEAPDLFR